MTMDKTATSNEYQGKDLEAMSFAVNYHKWILHRFSPYLSGVIAEVGAGNGNITRLLLETNPEELVAFEPSEKMYNILKDQLGSEIMAVNASLSTCHSEYQGYFDSVLYINVLEHIEHDAEELFTARDTLKKNGHLNIFVPAMSCLYSDFDKSIGHYRRYHKEQLIKLVSATGLQICEVRYMDLFGMIPWYILFVLMKKKLEPGAVDLYDKYLVPVIAQIESVVTPPLGKNLLVVAKKQEGM